MARDLSPPSDFGTDRPMAIKGLTSYRYRGTFGWIMIGAKDDANALREAKRSLSQGTPTLDKLEVWNGEKYEPCKVPPPKPELPEGLTWGADITLSDLKVGDQFVVAGTPRMGRFSGTIAKVARVNITYDTVYAPRPGFEQKMTLKAAKSDLIGGRVLRGSIVHEIK